MIIKMKLDIENVNKLCTICDSIPFDVNVMCGRVCVDGSSMMGVTQMCGRVVTLVPITQDEYEVETFFRKVKEIGAYKSEDFWG